MHAQSAFLALDQPRPGLLLALQGQPETRLAVGTVIGAALNQRAEFAKLAAAMHAPPYLAPPQRPVLYLKPANTHAATDQTLELDADVTQVAVAACLALVVGAPLAGATPQQAAAAILGYTLAADLQVPHTSFYRPAVRHQCRDGFCPLGPWIVPLAQFGTNGLADDLELTLSIDGQTVQRTRPSELIRQAAPLLAEISQFISCAPGDIVLLGASHGPALASAGARIAVSTPLIGSLQFSLRASAATRPSGALV